MATLTRKSIITGCVSLSAIALLIVVEWLVRPLDRVDLPLVLGFTLLVVMPLTVGAIPGIASMWLVISATSHWHGRRAAARTALLLALAGALYGVGEWLRALHGLDPPYGFFMAGAATQMVALVIPFVALAGAFAAIVDHMRGH